MPQSSSSLVVKSNRMINAKYNLSLSEMRLIQYMVTLISANDQDFTTYQIPIKVFASLTSDNKSKNVYERAKDTTKRLMERVLTVEEDDGPLQLSLVSSAKYYNGKGYVKLRFDPGLKPYLLDLKRSFTKYDLKNIMELGSFYSIRIYELLKQHAWKKNPEIQFSVDELKGMLALEHKYKSYNLFKKRVIEQAQKELKIHCDLTFTFKEIKEGRKVKWIVFLIKSQSLLPLEGDLGVKESLVYYGIPESQATDILQENDPQYVQQVIDYVLKQDKTKGVGNMGGYIISLIAKGADVSGSAYRQQKQGLSKQSGKQERQRKENQQKEDQTIKQLRLEYDQTRKEEIDKVISKFSERDYQNFEQYCANVPYLKEKLFSNGNFDVGTNEQTYEDALRWFAGDLTKYFKGDDQSFILWANENKGIHLKKDIDRVEKFRIEAKQEVLFTSKA